MPTTTIAQRISARIVVAALALMLALWPAAGRADGQVHLLYFYDPECSSCEAVHQEVIEPLAAAYGDKLVIEERNMAEQANFGLMLDLEQQYQVAASGIPEVFIGQDALIGPDEIRARLKERIDYYLAQGGVALPTVGQAGATPPAPEATTTSTAECSECEATHIAARTAAAEKRTAAPKAPPVIHIAFFYQPGCDACDRSEHDLKYIQEKYPQVQIARFNVKEEPALNQYLCERAGAPTSKHLTAPALFVGDRYLLDDQVRARPIEELLAPYLADGAPEPWLGWEEQKEAAERSIVERFRSFGLLTVVGAGLLDGVNPCAFATMIFLISYLSFRKREGRELLLTGAAFTAGVFLTYLGVGFGLLKFLTALPFLNVIGRWVYGVTAIICLALAWGSIADYRKAKEGRLEDMSLKLPERMRGWIKTLIREGSGAKRFVLSSFALGFGVSIVELACTGQVYLPTIIFMLGVPEWRTQAGLALVLYNLMFIIPLIVVFLVVYYGTTSQQLIDWMTKHASTVKLGMAALFLLLAGWMTYSVIAL